MHSYLGVHFEFIKGPLASPNTVVLISCNLAWDWVGIISQHSWYLSRYIRSVARSIIWGAILRRSGQTELFWAWPFFIFLPSRHSSRKGDLYLTRLGWWRGFSGSVASGFDACQANFRCFAIIVPQSNSKSAVTDYMIVKRLNALTKIKICQSWRP